MKPDEYMNKKLADYKRKKRLEDLAREANEEIDDGSNDESETEYEENT